MKSILIKDPVVAGVAQDIVALRAEFEQREAELQLRFQQEAEALSEEFNKRKDFLWDNLIDLTGLKPRDENGERSSYTIDNEYFAEHGLVFVIDEQTEDSVCSCPACRSMRGETASMESILEKLFNDPAVG